MLYRKIDFTFCGVNFFERALKYITLNEMEKKPSNTLSRKCVGVCQHKILCFNYAS